MNYYEDEDEEEEYTDKEYYEDRRDSYKRSRKSQSLLKQQSIYSEYLNAIRSEY